MTKDIVGDLEFVAAGQILSVAVFAITGGTKEGCLAKGTLGAASFDEMDEAQDAKGEDEQSCDQK